MKNKTIISSLVYKFIENVATKGLGLIVSVVLARLLAPEDFGLVAILTVFINLSLAVIESGLGSALIQRSDIQDEDYSTVFHISMVLAVLLVAILYIIAPVIAAYYESDILCQLMRVYSFSLLFGPFSSVQRAKLQKEMRFKAMMICGLVTTVVSGAVGIALALWGAGIWALIVYYFLYTVVTCVFLAAAGRWYPKLVFSWTRGKVLIDYGWKLLAATLLHTAYTNIRSLIIGKKFSKEDLGYYDRGAQVPQIIAGTMSGALSSVMFPTMSAAQGESGDLTGLRRWSMSIGAMLIFPSMIGLAAVAEPLIRIVFTEKWLPSLVLMQVLCLAELSAPFVASNQVVIQAMGKSGLYLKLEIVRKAAVLTILVISVVFFDSLLAIAVGFLAGNWLDGVLTTIAVKKIMGRQAGGAAGEILKIFGAALAMGAVVLALSAVPMAPLPLLFIQIIAGVLVYVGLCYALRVKSFRYAVDLVAGFARKKTEKTDDQQLPE